MKNPPWIDKTVKQRQSKRRSALDRVAKSLGYDTWSRMETAVINDLVTIKLTPNKENKQ